MILITMLIASVLMGCSLNQTSLKERQFNQIFPSVIMNTYLNIEDIRDAEGKITSYTTRDTIDIIFYNVSKDNIEFQRDKGIRIFIYDDKEGNWIEIKDNKIYYDDNIVITPPRTSINPGFGGISFIPKISNRDQPINLRVVVIGQIVKGGLPTGQLVGAYIDLDLKPK